MWPFGRQRAFSAVVLSAMSRSCRSGRKSLKKEVLRKPICDKNAWHLVVDESGFETQICYSPAALQTAVVDRYQASKVSTKARIYPPGSWIRYGPSRYRPARRWTRTSGLRLFSSFLPPIRFENYYMDAGISSMCTSLSGLKVRIP